MKVEIEIFSTRYLDPKSVVAPARNLQWRQVILVKFSSILSLNGWALKGRVQKSGRYLCLKTKQVMFWSLSIKNMTR